MSNIFRHYDGIYVSQRFTVCVPDGKQGKWFWVFDLNFFMNLQQKLP